MTEQAAEVFIRKLKNGEDLRFMFRETRFFIECWNEKDKSCLSLCRYRIFHAEERIEEFWECSAPTVRQCAEMFLGAALWGGRPFPEALEEFSFPDGDAEE